MTLHRIVQFIGPIAYLASFCTVGLYASSEALSGRMPKVGELLNARPGLTVVISLCLFFVGVYFTPPRVYGVMDREMLKSRHRTPLSRLLGRPAFRIVVEVVASLSAAVASMGTMIWAVIQILTRDPGSSVSNATTWAIVVGFIASFWSLVFLRRYIFP